MSMLKNEMLIWKSWRREGREDEGIQISLQQTKIIAILIGFDLVAMFNVIFNVSHFMTYFGRIGWPHKFAAVEIDGEQFFQD